MHTCVCVWWCGVFVCARETCESVCACVCVCVCVCVGYKVVVDLLCPLVYGLLGHRCTFLARIY